MGSDTSQRVSFNLYCAWPLVSRARQGIAVGGERQSCTFALASIDTGSTRAWQHVIIWCYSGMRTSTCGSAKLGNQDKAQWLSGAGTLQSRSSRVRGACQTRWTPNVSYLTLNTGGCHECSCPATHGHWGVCPSRGPTKDPSSGDTRGPQTRRDKGKNFYRYRYHS